MAFITPAEIKATINPQVEEAFNELIQKHWDGEIAIVPVDQVIVLIAEKLGIDVKEAFRRKHLSRVKPVAQLAGWQVLEPSDINPLLEEKINNKELLVKIQGIRERSFVFREAP